MGLNFWDDELEGPVLSENASESSEQHQDRAKKTRAQLQKAQKDEKKAQKDNDALFTILRKFIEDSYYVQMIPVISDLLRLSVPSRVIIAHLALFYPDATYYVLRTIREESKIESLLALYKYTERISFDEKVLDQTIRDWITEWVTFMEKFLSEQENSLIMQKKFVDIMESSEKKTIEWLFARFFQFFLLTRNIDIEVSTSLSYIVFIEKNLLVSMKKILFLSDDQEIFEEKAITVNDLFGFSEK